MDCRTYSITLCMSTYFTTQHPLILSMLLQMTEFCPFCSKYYFIAYVLYFIYLLLCRWNLGWYYILAVVNCTTIGMLVHVISFPLLGHLTVLLKKKTHHTTSCNGCTNLYSYQQCMRISLCLHPYQEKFMLFDTNYIFVVYSVVSWCIYWRMIKRS